MRSVCFLFLFILTGCVTPQQDKQPRAWLKPGVSVILPSPGLDMPVSEQQLLTANVKGKSYSLVALLDADKEQLTLAGLSSLGIRLFLLHYDKDGIRTEQSVMLPEIPPAEQVLSDIMLSYWPVARWAPQLPQGWTLTDNGDQRELRDEQKQIVSLITYSNAQGERIPVQIDNQIFSYQIIISHLETTP
ncbi:DUF3261 domain-containing protein [Morganella psychrotolerans]|uniref:DUF3261 domain-containing protein n=1 Tax=Morganella psychrotolerans TaxID=368603 RepID=A0A5M9R527_9GAMM|nr:DUF3261 domain-containing protein [Morganella psychrotolerans]KAA8715673.1 DUF3261 domain-containing protein [Morganella psychrotolerans]OBU05709.1 hypothetical protein AYY16_10850 [Morganella psychrotolerans]